MIKVTRDRDGLAQVVRMTYTQLGHLHTETAYDGPNQTGNAQVTTYSHDKQGRRKSVTFPDASSWHYELDDAGLVKQRTDARNIITIYTRNWRGQVLTATVDGQQEEYYEYDALGRRGLARRDADNYVSFDYDDLGNLTGETQTVWGLTKTFSYPDYTRSGRRRTVQYPADTGVTLVYEYDKLDNVTAIKRDGVSLITYPQYVGDRWLQRIVTLGANPSTTLTSTAAREGLARRVYGIAHCAQRDSQTLYTETLDFSDRDRVGNPNTVVRAGHPPAAGTSSYDYDTLHRVADAEYAADSTTEDINLDVLGNRTTYTGRMGPQITYTHNLVNQYTGLDPQVTAPQYDANGNLTRNDRGFQFEYDYENRLTLIKAPNGLELAMYCYDALGRRNSEWRSDAVVLGDATAFFFDGQNVAVEYDYIYYDLLRYYVHGATYIDERAVVHEAAENKDYAFAVNDVYSVIALVDDQGQVVGAYSYDVYGLMRPSGPTDRDPRYAFQGRPLAVYQTAQGATLPIYDFRARSYDPVLGRFMQHDPADYIDSYNLYLAMGGNPLVWLDPSGESLMELLWSTSNRAGPISMVAAAAMRAQGVFQSVAQAISFRSQMITGLMNTAARMGTRRGAAFLDRATQVMQGTSGRIFTASNYRANFEWLYFGRTGVLRPDQTVHHLFNKGGELGEWFLSRGIDPNNPLFLALWRNAEHLGRNSAAITNRWTQFMLDNRTATIPQIFNFARNLAQEFGFTILF